MNKKEYLAELTLKLKGLREEDIADAITYCEEYFEEAGEDNEQQAMKDLGTPSKFAAQIKAENIIRENKATKDRKHKGSMKNIVMIFLGVCALPIALPLFLAAISLLFAFFIVIAALLFSALVIIVAFIFSGILLIISGFTNIQVIGNACIAFGGGLLLMGVAIAVLAVFMTIIPMLIPLFMRFFTHLYYKAKGGYRHGKE